MNCEGRFVQWTTYPRQAYRFCLWQYHMNITWRPTVHYIFKGGFKIPTLTKLAQLWRNSYYCQTKCTVTVAHRENIFENVCGPNFGWP